MYEIILMLESDRKSFIKSYKSNIIPGPSDVILSNSETSYIVVTRVFAIDSTNVILLVKPSK